MSSASAFSQANTPSDKGSAESKEVYSAWNTQVRAPKSSVLPFGAYFTRDVPGAGDLFDSKAAFDRRGGVVL